MTIGNLMRLLSDGEVHSGEQLGEALGVSRAAVWKQLKKLEALGVELVAVKGRGYRLAHPLEPLDGAKIVERLPADARHLLARLFVEDQLPSSNEYLRERFSQGAGHGEVCFVELQTAGRGRRGRRTQQARHHGRPHHGCQPECQQPAQRRASSSSSSSSSSFTSSSSSFTATSPTAVEALVASLVR